MYLSHRAAVRMHWTSHGWCSVKLGQYIGCLGAALIIYSAKGWDFLEGFLDRYGENRVTPTQRPTGHGPAPPLAPACLSRALLSNFFLCSVSSSPRTSSLIFLLKAEKGSGMSHSLMLPPKPPRASDHSWEDSKLLSCTSSPMPI